MEFTKLSENLNALTIDPQNEVLLVQCKNPHYQNEAENVAHALRDFSKKTGINCLIMSNDIKLTVVKTGA